MNIFRKFLFRTSDGEDCIHYSMNTKDGLQQILYKIHIEEWLEVTTIPERYITFIRTDSIIAVREIPEGDKQ